MNYKPKLFLLGGLLIGFIALFILLVLIAPSLKSPTTKTTSSPTPQSLGNKGVLTLSLSNTKEKFSFVYPINWNEASEYIEPSPASYDLPYPGVQDMDSSKKQIALFTNFPYKNKIYPQQYSSVGLYRYPSSFTSDPSDDGPYTLTASEKQAIITPLLTIYNDRSVKNVPLSQRTYDGEGMGKYFNNNTDLRLRGSWWGNLGATQDRINPHYYESSDGSFRGVGYFSFDGHVAVVQPTYRLILINPTKNLIFQGYIDVPSQPFATYEEEYKAAVAKDYEIALKNNDVAYASVSKVIKNVYDSLENIQANASTPDSSLEKFLADVDALVQSSNLK